MQSEADFHKSITFLSKRDQGRVMEQYRAALSASAPRHWWQDKRGQCSRESHCQCGGDTQGVREGCYHWSKYPGVPALSASAPATEPDWQDTCMKVLDAIGYTTEAAEIAARDFPKEKISEAVTRFLQLKASSAPAAKCQTCGGHGLIGGFVGSQEGGGYESHPCPDCAPAAGSGPSDAEIMIVARKAVPSFAEWPASCVAFARALLAQHGAPQGGPVYLAQLRNGSTTWLRFAKVKWDALPSVWNRYVAYAAPQPTPGAETEGE